MEMENYIVGIDFGTTYSCMAVWKDGGLVIIPNGVGERTTPSVVIFDGPDKVFVGEETLNHLSKNESVKIYEIKRLLGKKYDQIQHLLKYFPYKIIKEENGDRPMIEMTFGKKILKYYPEDIATLILKKLMNNAQAFLGNSVKEILITVPADFTEYQKLSVRHSAEQIQGLKVLQVINEPSAAVLAYGFPKQYIKNKFFPFNQYFSLVKAAKKELHPMEEISISTSTNVDITVTEHLNDRNTILIDNENKTEKDESNDSLLININNSKNENIIKCSLLSQYKDLMKIIVFDLGGGTYDVSLIYVDKDKNFETMVYKGDEKLGGSDFDNKLIDYCLKDFCIKNKYDEKKIRGNYRRMQRLKRACEETKKILSVKLEDNIVLEDFYESNPLCCHITRAKFEELSKDLFMRLIKPLDSILEEKNLNNTDIDEIVLVGGSSKIPKVKEIIQAKFPNIPINDQISPDEAVAYGACIYAESLRRFEGDFWKNFTYIDKTGHSYGIETEDGSLQVIIPKGTKYPVSKSYYFHTVYDDQYNFDINVYEGEGKFIYENQKIGQFLLEGIPQKPKGEVIMKVTIRIEKNQSIKVTAFVQEGNIKRNLVITRDNQLPKNNNENLIINENELNYEEKEIQSYIFEYSKNFALQKDDKDKYELIKKYNDAMIKYLNFFEKNYNDTSSEKYLYLLEKLFKSYTYFFNTSLINLIDLNEKKKIKESIQSFLEKISVKGAFRIKQLLNYFKNVKYDNFIEILDIIIFSMELIYNKATVNFNKNEKNHVLYAKTLYQECLIISEAYIKDSSKLELNLMEKYKKMMKDCDRKIKLISAMYLTEIEKLKTAKKLFNNETKLEKDDLSLLSYNLELAVKTINTIENLNENQEALETKSFYLANIVKIEFLKKEKNMNFTRLEQHAQESIKIAKELKKNVKGDPWFKEIVKLSEDIEKKKKNINPAPPAQIIDIDQIEEKFMNILDEGGNEELLRYILKNYPYTGYSFTEETIEEYKQNKRSFLNNLRRKYGASDFNGYLLRPIENENLFSELNDKILEYIGKMIDNI